jgi:hypothetical protein
MYETIYRPSPRWRPLKPYKLLIYYIRGRLFHGYTIDSRVIPRKIEKKVFG